MIPTRCLVCGSSRVFLECDRLLCHDCGEVSYWDSWYDYDDEGFSASLNMLHAFKKQVRQWNECPGGE